MEKKYITKLEDLDTACREYKSKKSDAPIFVKDFGVTINTNSKEIILTAEEYDRDGEIVDIEGMEINSSDVEMIDSHAMYESVVSKGLGAVRNVRKEERNGRLVIVGEPDFAPTPNGKIAETLYMGVNGGRPYFKNVSIGFAVYDYDNKTKRISRSELYEMSLITVGSNRSARFVDKKSVKKDGKQVDQIAKDLARFKQIHAPFKEFSKLFLSEKFCKTIGYEKDGDLLIDINGIYDMINIKFSSKESANEEAPRDLETKQIESQEIDQLIWSEIEARLGK